MAGAKGSVQALAGLPGDTPDDIRDFLAHWFKLRIAGPVPLLSDYLDRVVPRLQPFVMISDVGGPTAMRVRLMGTGLVAMLGQDATGGTIDQYYAPQIRDAVALAVEHVVRRPAGYLCVRTVRTVGGLVLSSPSICLPLHNPRFAGATIVSYTHVDRALADLATREQFDPVQDLRVTHWIDIGAGVPDWAFARSDV